MKVNIFLFLIFISQYVFSQEVTFEGIETKNEITYLKGTNEPFTGKVVAFNINGKKSIEIEYKNGKETGTNRSWFANGNLMNETQLTDGKIDGLWIDYYESGKKMNGITYENDYMTGPCTRWYENGNIKESGNHHHCKENGYWVYYFENGQKQTAGEYSEAQKIGDWIEWNEKGVVLKTVNYKK
jgi:antitoxin component YwqK of YwqJK toxin-antitoxin module